MKKIRKVVELYNEAVANNNEDDIKLYADLNDDQRQWEHENWKQGFNDGYLSAALGAVVGVVIVVAITKLNIGE